MEEIVAHYRHAPPRCSALQNVHTYNNYVKAALIQAFLKPNGQVLDMPCGRGGDLKKYRENKAGFYYGVDLVPERIEEAKTRHKTTRCMYGAVFDVGDFTQPLSLETKYDFISCQFALHYAWDTEEHALQVIKNASEHIRSNGVFVLTFPDWDFIVGRLQAMHEQPDSYNYTRTTDETITYRIGGPRHYLEFSSTLVFAEFVEHLTTHPYGQKYIYFQEGAINGLPEYLVHPRAFKEMCHDHGFIRLHEKNFLAFQEHAPFGLDTRELRHRMGVKPLADRESLDIVGLYKTVVLQTNCKRRKI